MKTTLKRVIVLVGLGIFSGLSILNMQTYLALAKVAYGLVKFLPFAWFLDQQKIPWLLAAIAGSSFLMWRGKKFNPFLACVVAIALLGLIVVAFKSPELSVSVFGVLLWGTSTACQTAPFWVKSFFFDAMIGAFRAHEVEATTSSDNEATKDLVERRNNLPQEILASITTGAFIANGLDILLGIWQYPIMSWENLTKFNFSMETVAVDSVLKVLLLSVLPELVLLLMARYFYLCAIDTSGSRKEQKTEKRKSYRGVSYEPYDSGDRTQSPKEGRAQRRHRQPGRRRHRQPGQRRPNFS